MRVNSFNHFRAIAIVFIVAAHCYTLSGLKFYESYDILIRNLITGGTFLFLFISGFLFYQVFYDKFNYKSFITKKALNVLIPYIILGFLPVFMHVFTKKDVFDGYFLPQGVGIYYEYIEPGVKYYLSGRFLTAYWYIPFIMLTFLFSPLHVKYIKLPAKIQIVIIVTLSLISVLIHRPVSNISLLQNFIYFTPVYLIGITASKYRNLIYCRLKGKEWTLLLIVVFIAVLQTKLGIVGNFHKPALEYSGIDIVFVQKVILCFFFMVFLNRFEDKNNKLVDMLANTSFAIFFIHPFLIFIMYRFEVNIFKQDSWFIYLLLVSMLILISIMLANAVKFVLKKRSRMLLGY